MKSLLIDTGNTSCKYAISGDGVLGSFMRDDGADIVGTSEALLCGQKPDYVVFSSVRGRNMECMDALSRLGGRLIVLDSRTPLPIAIDYETPGTLGADRIAAAVGAHRLFPGEDVLVFDFGTAITIDRITAEGVFAGGNISIGLRSRLKALNMLTVCLPEVSVEGGGRQALGRSTTEALWSGAVSGTVFEVEGYINSYPGHRIVFSGGDSIFLAKRMKNPIFADYNLVLKGLAYIAEHNAQM